MSRKEYDRGVVLERVGRGDLTLLEAAEVLGLSYRQAKRLAARYRAGGRAALVHGNVGRPSNRSRPLAERERAIQLLGEVYGGGTDYGPGQRFGPTLASEHLAEEHGLDVPRTTLVDWMKPVGLWTRVRKSRPKPRRRERRAHFGELVQLDGSFHDWYEGRGERAGALSCVMNMVDDATGRTLLHFGDQETTWAAARVLRLWIGQHGVPRALYTDWSTVYKREPTSQEKILGLEAHTQFGLMCHKLGIRIVAAGSPQAKGRVERSNGVHQDRLIKKMRILGISDDGAANTYAREKYLPQHNSRFSRIPGSPADYHLPLDPGLNLDHVFCLEHTRVVGNDYVVRFEGQALQLDRAARGRVPAGTVVLVRQTEDGVVRIVRKLAGGAEIPCRWSPAAGTPSPAEPSERKPRRVASPKRPAPDHPWRSYSRAAAVSAQAASTGQKPLP
jgi:hypothetical protein